MFSLIEQQQSPKKPASKSLFDIIEPTKTIMDRKENGSTELTVSSSSSSSPVVVSSPVVLKKNQATVTRNSTSALFDIDTSSKSMRLDMSGRFIFE